MSLKCGSADADVDVGNDFDAATAAAMEAAVGRFWSLDLLYIFERFEWDVDKLDSLQ
jgi:hypothetical protein